jgi:hypothetical protein
MAWARGDAMRAVIDRIDAALERPRAGIAIALALAAVVAAAGFTNDFVYDDVPIIRDNALVHSLTHWPALWTATWWPPPFVQQLYRPLALALLAAQYAVGGGAPLAFRVVSGALYVCGVLAVWRLASRLVPRRVAATVAILFAVHPVHVEAVAQGVNQGELVVGIAAALMVTLYLDRRRAGAVRARDWAAMALLYMVAFLAKESGYVLPALIVAAGVVAPSRARALGPGLIALGAVAAGGLMARHAALAGYGFDVQPVPGLRGLGIGERLYTMLQVVPQWLRLLAFPLHLQADFADGAFPFPAAFGIAEAMGVVVVVGGALVAWRVRRVAPVATFGIAWCAVTLLPVSNIVPTGIMLAERTLYVPSIGFLLAVAALASQAVAGTRAGARVRAGVVMLCWAAAVFGLVRSVNRMSLWNSAHLEVTGATATTSDE